jgi:hypothetical protein
MQFSIACNTLVLTVACAGVAWAAPPRSETPSAPKPSSGSNPYQLPAIPYGWEYSWSRSWQGGRYLQQDFNLQAMDDTKVRRKNPPAQYDSKGNPKRYTPKELKELQGPDPKLPGYTADWDDLKRTQFLRVYLVKEKETPKYKAGKEDDKPKMVPAGELYGQLIRMDEKAKEFTLRVRFPTSGRTGTLPPYPNTEAAIGKGGTGAKKPLAATIVILTEAEPEKGKDKR